MRDQSTPAVRRVRGAWMLPTVSEGVKALRGDDLPDAPGPVLVLSVGDGGPFVLGHGVVVLVHLRKGRTR